MFNLLIVLLIIKNKIYIFSCYFLVIILVSFKYLKSPFCNNGDLMFLIFFFLLNNKAVIIIFKSVDLFKFQNIINDTFIFYYVVTYFFETVIYELFDFLFRLINARFGSLNYMAIVCFIVKKVLLFFEHY